MAREAPCQTPGAHYSIGIHTGLVKHAMDVGQTRFLRDEEGNKIPHPPYSVVSAAVCLPFELHLSLEEAEALEARVHNALEAALAPYFVGETALGLIRDAVEAVRAKHVA